MLCGLVFVRVRLTCHQMSTTRAHLRVAKNRCVAVNLLPADATALRLSIICLMTDEGKTLPTSVSDSASRTATNAIDRWISIQRCGRGAASPPPPDPHHHHLSRPAKQQGRKAIPTNTHFRYDVHRIDPASYATAHHGVELPSSLVAAGRDLPPQKN